MICTNCKKVSEGEVFQKEFCSETCFISWVNALRLIFPTEMEDIEASKANAHAAITKLISQRSIEENMFVCEILTSVIVQLSTLILPQRAKKEIEGRIEQQKKRAANIRAEVNERDSNLVVSSAKKRAQQELIKSEGVKASPDGKCKFCKAPTPGVEFCSAEHKQMYKAAEGFMRNMKIDLQTAIEMVSEIK